MTIADAAGDNEVYISGCVGAVIFVTAKVKTIGIHSCTKTKVIFEGAISTCEVRTPVVCECVRLYPCVLICLGPHPPALHWRKHTCSGLCATVVMRVCMC